MKFTKRRAPIDLGVASEGEAPRAKAFADPQAQAAPPLEPPITSAATSSATPRTPAHRGDLQPAPAYLGPPTLDDMEPPSGWPIWVAALAISVLWGLAPIAFAVGYRANVAPLQEDAFALAIFALLAIGPAAFVWGAAFMIRQGQKLAFEARRTKAMAEDMLSPAMIAAARAGHVAQSVREEIARAGGAAEEARDSLLALRDALAMETEQLVGAAAQSVRTAEELAGTLGRERSEMKVLGHDLDAQAARVSDAITQQARMVAEAADLAETQIREAETALSARAADLAAAAGETRDAARLAGEDLTRHIARLETAGHGVAEQVRAVEGGLTEQRTALVALSQVLRDDHGAFAQEAADHAAALADFITQARISSLEMSDRATKGGEALRQLMADAAGQFRDLADAAQAEREEFGRSTLQGLEAVSEAAADQRALLETQTRAAVEALARAAEETRAAAARHAGAAREQVDQLSEAAFAAGQKANQVFEARLEEARALVEQSSRMVEDAGSATARKLQEGAAAARETLDELAAMMGEVEVRAARLPPAARGHADQVRAMVTQGMDELMAQARRTAEEAQAIDAAFQDRVRRNFEMLSEAVRLMGTAASAPSPLVAGAPTKAPARATARVRPEPAPPEAASPETGPALADKLGLRPRLKLTATASDAEFSSAFEAAGGPAAADAEDSEEDAEADGEPWSWKDLLASLDGADGEGPRLEAALSDELARMGVEPERLLPRARVDEIAAVLQAGDAEGARQVVKKLAPAAARRIARRLFTDDEVRRQAEIYVRRYKTLVDDAIARDREGFLLADLLGAEAGRLYLLLDAAAGDMI